jgi:thiol-disulfide isomerase/thioredoxin
MKKYSLLLAIFLLLGVNIAFAQQTTVNGKVLGSDGNAMAGAQVSLIRGHVARKEQPVTLAKAETGKDGSFKISLEESFKPAAGQPALFLLEFSSQDHLKKIVPLFAGKPTEIGLEVKLAKQRTYPPSDSVTFKDTSSVAAKFAQLYSYISPISDLWQLSPQFIEGLLTTASPTIGYDEYIMLVVDKHPDADLKAKLLYRELMTAKMVDAHDKARIYYDRLTGELGETKFGKSTKERFSRDPAVVVGKAVPAFSFVSLEDSKVAYTSENMKGKVYLLDFWATWCGPCVGEMGNMHQAYERFKGKNFEIISLSFDEEAGKIGTFRSDKWKMPWRHSFIEGGFTSQAARQFEVIGIPKPILVDSKGTVLAVGNELRGKQLEETLARVLGETK